MKALKTALIVFITGVALSFASQAKATTDCHPVMLSFYSANSPYPSGMAPLFDEKCNFVKYIPVSGNVSFVAPMPNAVTTTIPVTTTTIHKPNWKQAGCDDLTELNKEWRDTWAYTDKYWQASADWKIDVQNNPKWNVLYGEPKDRQSMGYGCNNKLNWEIVTVKVKQFVWMYTLCADGWQSGSRGRGTCSWHGGVSDERGYYKTASAKRIQFYWVH